MIKIKCRYCNKIKDENSFPKRWKVNCMSCIRKQIKEFNSLLKR